jgi:hypothetical protein
LGTCIFIVYYGVLNKPEGLKFYFFLISTSNTRVDITFNHSWNSKNIFKFLKYIISIHFLQMNNHLKTNSFIFFSTELRLFPFRLKFMCVNGVAVEVKWENLIFISIDFFTIFFNGDSKWASIASTTLNIQWVCNEFYVAVYVLKNQRIQ